MKLSAPRALTLRTMWCRWTRWYWSSRGTTKRPSRSAAIPCMWTPRVTVQADP